MCTVYYVLPSNSLKENAPLQFLFKGSIDDEEEDDVFPSMTSFLLISIISLSYKVINMDWLAILTVTVAFFHKCDKVVFWVHSFKKRLFGSSSQLNCSLVSFTLKLVTRYFTLTLKK